MSNIFGSNGNNGGSSSTLIIVLLALACCCCLLSCIVPVGFYVFDQQFKDWVNSFFGGNTPSSSASTGTGPPDSGNAQIPSQTSPPPSYASLQALQTCPFSYQTRDATGKCVGCPKERPVWRPVNNVWGCNLPLPKPGTTGIPFAPACPFGYKKNTATNVPASKACVEKNGSSMSYKPEEVVQTFSKCTNSLALACPPGSHFNNTTRTCPYDVVTNPNSLNANMVTVSC